jgi:type I restriction enzyme S subunit
MDFDDDEIERFSVLPGDVLVCEGGEVGRTAIWTGQLPWVGYQKALHRLRPASGISAPYIAYLMRWFASTDLFEPYVTGSTIKHLPQEDVRLLPVPVPPEREQLRIVAAIEEQFSRLDAAEAGLRRISRKLGAMRSAVVEQLLGGEWVRIKIKNCGDGSRYALAIGPFGSNLKTTDYRESGVPLVFVRNIRASSFGDATAKFVAAPKAAELAAHVVRSGDVLVTKMGDPPGDTAVYPLDAPDAIITADCIKISLSDAFEPRFVALAIAARDARRQILDATKGVAQKKVSLARFKEVEIPAPPIHEQVRIVAEAERHLSIADALAKQVGTALSRSASLRRSILERAFAGDLVPQEPTDEPASALLERIVAARGGETQRTRTRATVPV